MEAISETEYSKSVISSSTIDFEYKYSDSVNQNIFT